MKKAILLSALIILLNSCIKVDLDNINYDINYQALLGIPLVKFNDVSISSFIQLEENENIGIDNDGHISIFYKSDPNRSNIKDYINFDLLYDTKANKDFDVPIGEDMVSLLESLGVSPSLVAFPFTLPNPIFPSLLPSPQNIVTSNEAFTFDYHIDISTIQEIKQVDSIEISLSGIFNLTINHIAMSGNAKILGNYEFFDTFNNNKVLYRLYNVDISKPIPLINIPNAVLHLKDNIGRIGLKSTYTLIYPENSQIIIDSQDAGIFDCNIEFSSKKIHKVYVQCQNKSEEEGIISSNISVELGDMFSNFTDISLSVVDPTLDFNVEIPEGIQIPIEFNLSKIYIYQGDDSSYSPSHLLPGFSGITKTLQAGQNTISFDKETLNKILNEKPKKIDIGFNIATYGDGKGHVDFNNELIIVNDLLFNIPLHFEAGAQFGVKENYDLDLSQIFANNGKTTVDTEKLNLKFDYSNGMPAVLYLNAKFKDVDDNVIFSQNDIKIDAAKTNSNGNAIEPTIGMTECKLEKEKTKVLFKTKSIEIDIYIQTKDGESMYININDVLNLNISAFFNASITSSNK